MVISNINKDQFVRMVQSGLIDKGVLSKSKISESESNYEVNGKRATLVTIVVEDANAVSGSDYLAALNGSQGTKVAAREEGKSAIAAAASK
jgi:hypothetical protein